MIGTILLVLLAPIVAELAVDIGAPDYFAIMVLAFIAVTSVLGSSRIRGLASLLIGLTIGLVGLDQMTGQQRLTFGSLQLADGIDVVIVAVGLFAVGEALWVAAHLRRSRGEPIPVGRPWLGKADVRRTWKPWLRGPRHRLPVRRDPGRRRGDPDLPVVRRRRSGCPSTRRSSARARSRAWPGRSRRQRLGGGHPGVRC